jgi:hypothetical protein
VNDLKKAKNSKESYRRDKLHDIVFKILIFKEIIHKFNAKK